MIVPKLTSTGEAAEKHTRPKWLSAGSMVGLIFQLLFSGYIVYAIAVNYLGIAIPNPGFERAGTLTHAVMLFASLTSVFAVIGIVRNRWWAYFAELILLWTVAYSIDPQIRYRTALLSVFESIDKFLKNCWILALVIVSLHITWALIKSGVDGYYDWRRKLLSTTP